MAQVTPFRNGEDAPALGRLLCLLIDRTRRCSWDVCAHAEPLEYQVKAVFLLNFTKFIEWPTAAFGAADSPIAICVLGDDPFGSTLDQVVAGEVVSGRKVVVQRIKKALPPQSCQVLFFSGTEKALNYPSRRGARRADYRRRGAFYSRGRHDRFRGGEPPRAVRHQ